MLDPLLAGVLVHLVALDHLVAQRVAVEPPGGVVLHEMAELQQVLAVATQLASQLRRRHALSEAAKDEHDLGGRAVGPRQRGVGEGVEDAATGGAAVIENRGAMAAMDVEMVIGLAVGAVQAVGMEPAD